MLTLSVISPVRNQERFIEQALDSVAALTVPHEHIVVDGASTDGTVQILRSRQDPNLRWISEPDTGQAQAMNRGLARAGGGLIGWLNGDDEYVAPNVDAAVGYLDAHPEVDAIFGGMDFVDEHGELLRRYVPAEWSWRRYLFLGDYVQTPTIIFRRRLLAAAPTLNESFRDASDYDFYLRLLHRRRVDMLPEPLVRFKYHATSKTGSNVWIQQDEALRTRLRWARGPRDRAAMLGFDRAKRAILPRISNWPAPHPGGVVKLLERLRS